MPSSIHLLALALLSLSLQTCAAPIDEPSNSIRTLPVKRQSSTSIITQVPDFALKYAPYVYLHADEEWFPTDVKNYLPRVQALSSTNIILNTSNSGVPTFSSLSALPSTAYLTSTEDITKLLDPSWLNSMDGKPDVADGRSSAPVEIIVAPKDGGIVDVFYFMFYAFNRGPEVLGNSFGDHLGDWEHVLTRFTNSQPTSIYLSAHDSGTAYEWNAIMKQGDNSDIPVIYASKGDHAMYAMPGTHSYDTILMDETSAGTLWDISANYRGYLFDSTNGQFTLLDSSASTAAASTTTVATEEVTAAGEDTDETIEGTDWLTYTGYWGDKQYPDDDPRQFCLLGHCRYVDGPFGPYLKNLGRIEVCQDENECDVKSTL